MGQLSPKARAKAVSNIRKKNQKKERKNKKNSSLLESQSQENNNNYINIRMPIYPNVAGYFQTKTASDEGRERW